MENAAKALLIAGAVLIAIMIATLFTYVIRQMGTSTSSLYSMLDDVEISKFNQQFLNYKGRGVDSETTPLTVQDVATLINLAIDCKEKSLITVQIICNEENLVETYTYSSKWLEANQQSTSTYKCTDVHINSDTRLVDKVIIEKIT